MLLKIATVFLEIWKDFDDMAYISDPDISLI